MRKVMSIVGKVLALVSFLVGTYMACLLDSENWVAPFIIVCITAAYLFFYSYKKGWMD